MADDAQKWLVETEWLASHLDTPGLVILDGSMHLPTAKRDAKAEYLAGHIPGALFFDIDDIADEKSPLPHMLPSSTKFARPLPTECPVSSTMAAMMPGSGSVHEPGTSGVAPGSGVIMWPPVSVCHQVSTIGQRPPPTCLVVPHPRFRIDRLADRAEDAQARQVVVLRVHRRRRPRRP